MKYLSFALLLAVMACQEENVIPANHGGKYVLESESLKMSFDLVYEYGIYRAANGRMIYPGVNKTRVDHVVTPINRTAEGYQLIKIHPHYTQPYRVALHNCKFTDAGMEIGEIRITGSTEVILPSQVMTRFRAN